MKEVDVSIVIPAFNSSSTIGATIEACLNQDYPLDKIEIIVVDDGSKDTTRDTVKKYPVRYIYQEKKGPASARNTGWRAARGDAICFIDADCVPYKDWIFKLVRHYDREHIGAIAGSYAVDGAENLLDKFVHHEIKYRHSLMPLYSHSFGTYNVLIKRYVLEELGGFDSSFSTASGEDSDLSYRIIKRGYRIYFEKDALVSHHNILKLSKYLATQFRHSFWRMKLYKKNISMVSADEYGYWKDFVEIFLIIALIIDLFFMNKHIFLWPLTALVFLIQWPLAIKISLQQKDARYIVFSFITFSRAFLRLIGGITGFIVFWIFRR